MRRIAVIFVGVLLAVGALTTVTASAAGPPLGEYVVFGLNGVNIGKDSTVIGLVGAKDNDPQTGYALSLQGGAKIVNGTGAVVGDARSGGNVRMLNNTQIQNKLTRAVGTTISKSASAVIGTEVIADPELPSLPAPTPAVCTKTAGAPDDSGANSETRSPTPGNYGDWKFNANFTLNLLTPGEYYFNSIKTANGTTVNAVPGVKIFVCGQWSNGGGFEILPNTLTAGDVQIEVQSSDFHNAFKVGGNFTLIGDVITPNGGIHLGSGGSTGSVLGHLWAGGQVDLEHSVVVNAPGGGGNNQPSTGKDASLLHSAKNENNGANNSLRVAYQLASVIGFDVSQVNLGNVQSAKLTLTVCNTPGDFNFCPEAPNGAPFGWPAAGGRVATQRLVDGWEDWGSDIPPTNTPPEGNGNNFPINNNPRGSGAGVTWNCAIDTNIANEARDCTNPSNGGKFWNAGLDYDTEPPINSNDLLFDNVADGTKITFDVTVLVQQGMGPLDTKFMSFFIRKPANTGGGFVSFYSFQGAAAKNDPSLAPKLEIT